MRIELGYPDPAAERAMLRDATATSHRIELAQRIDARSWRRSGPAVDRVHASESLLDYVQRLAQRSREPGEFAVGLSPRGVLALLRSAKTWALMDDRDHVLPDDVQAVLPAVTAHRLQPGGGFAGDGAGPGGAAAA
jgi:MoxR-like ATPase